VNQNLNEVTRYVPDNGKTFRDQVLESELVHASIAAIAALISFPILLFFAFGDEVTLHRNWRITLSIIALPFLFVFISRMLALCVKPLKHLAAITEAWIEIMTNKDWNKSGGIGDVLEIPANTTDDSPVIHRQVFVSHVTEFMKRKDQLLGMGRKNWVARSQWLKEAGAVNDFQFSDGMRLNRKEYEQIVEMLEKMGVIVGRGKGRSGDTSDPTLSDVIDQIG